MYFMSETSDKNGIQLQIGDEVVHVANPGIKGKIVSLGTNTKHYLGSSWVRVIFENQVRFSGNIGRVSTEWLCSASLLEKK